MDRDKERRGRGETESRGPIDEYGCHVKESRHTCVFSSTNMSNPRVLLSPGTCREEERSRVEMGWGNRGSE